MHMCFKRNFMACFPLLVFLFSVGMPTLLFATPMLYWTEKYGSKIMASNLDGTEKTTILSGISGPSGIDIDLLNKKIYCVSVYGTNTSKIIRCDLDGSNVEDLAVNLTNPCSIAIDVIGSKMYWSDLGSGSFQRIFRANLNGSEKEILYTGNGSTDLELDLVNFKIYFSEYISGGLSAIKCMNFDGSNVVTVVDGLSTPNGIALDIENQKIYWTDSGTDKIQRTNLDGTGKEDLVTSFLNIPLDLELINNQMYWADYGNNVIQCANLDGSDIYTIANGLNRPSYLSIVPEPGTILLFCFGGLAITRRKPN